MFLIKNENEKKTKFGKPATSGRRAAPPSPGRAGPDRHGRPGGGPAGVDGRQADVRGSHTLVFYSTAASCVCRAAQGKHTSAALLSPHLRRPVCPPQRSPPPRSRKQRQRPAIIYAHACIYIARIKHTSQEYRMADGTCTIFGSCASSVRYKCIHVHEVMPKGLVSAMLGQLKYKSSLVSQG